MKIAFLIRSLDYGGAERQLVALAESLKRQGHSIVVATFYSGGQLENDLRKAAVPVVSLEKKGRWDLPGFLWRLIRFVRNHRPDVLHGYLGIPNVLTVILKPFVPRLQSVWGVRASNMNLDYYDWVARLSYSIECFLSRFANLIIVNSRAGFDYAVDQGFSRSRMIIIPNGIDTTRFRPDRSAGECLRAEWGAGPDDILIGVAARLDPMKDHATFLRAAALVTRESQNVRFVCVGDGPRNYSSQLIALGLQLGLNQNLVWAGARSDMPAVYNALDVLVSSSLGEGFPNVIGEAMSCGVPTVATDVGDSALIIGETGLIVPPADPDALKTALIKTAQRIRAADFNRGAIRQRIVDCFSVSALEQRTEAALLCLSQNMRVA
ncbi:MAG TPA: glycosyltransferase [Blastocatellia bacterium]|nr:glycosyltransferase [Blastocatellia bacterium]